MFYFGSRCAFSGLGCRDCRDLGFRVLVAIGLDAKRVLVCPSSRVAGYGCGLGLLFRVEPPKLPGVPREAAVGVGLMLQ